MIYKSYCRHDQDMKIALVLRKVDVFGGHTTNVTITEANYPENARFVQTRVGQLILAMNCPGNIEQYDCKPNEVKLNTPLYNIDSGGFLGLKKILAFIMVSGDQDETFFSDGFAKANSKKLYSTSKKLIPNIFSGIYSRNIKTF